MNTQQIITIDIDGVEVVGQFHRREHATAEVEILSPYSGHRTGLFGSGWDMVKEVLAELYLECAYDPSN